MLTDCLLLTGKIQEVILQEQLEKEDEVLVSLAGLKQVLKEQTHTQIHPHAHAHTHGLQLGFYFDTALLCFSLSATLLDQYFSYYVSIKPPKSIQIHKYIF